MTTKPQSVLKSPQMAPRGPGRLPSQVRGRGLVWWVALASVAVHGLAFGVLSTLRRPLPPAPHREESIPLPPQATKPEYQVRLAPRPEPPRSAEPAALPRIAPVRARASAEPKPSVARAPRPPRQAPAEAARPSPAGATPPVLDLTQATAGVDPSLTSGSGPQGFTLGTTALGDPAGPPGAKGGARAPARPAPPAAAGAPNVPASSAVLRSVKRMPEPLSVPTASYPPDAKRRRVEGTVRLLVTVDPGGRVVAVRVLSGLGHGLDQAAQKALEQARFRPAIGSDDRPLQYSIRYRYTFRLEG